MSVADNLVPAYGTPIYGAHWRDCLVKGEPLAEPLSAGKAEELAGIEAAIEGIASRFVVFRDGGSTADSDYLVSLPYVGFLSFGLAFIRRMRAIRSRVYGRLVRISALREEVDELLCYCDGCRYAAEDGTPGFQVFHFNSSSCAGMGCEGESFNPTTQVGTAKEAQ